MSENPAKRQRLTGSFSPASPPYHVLAKSSDQQTKTVVHPNTPTSPPYMSSASQPNGPAASSATAPSIEMTPPSSVTMSQQASQAAASAGNPLPFPTPASTTGAISSSTLDSDGDAMMIDDGNEDAAKTAAPLTTSAHRRSNHDRQGRGTVFGETGAHGSALYKLCNSPHQISRPHGSQNLFQLYNLNDIASSVARTDLVTGEKINKLRKSYEGKIKDLQVPGKPKARAMENCFMQHLLVPDEDYRLSRVEGKELQKGLSPDILASLDEALSMAKGPLPPKVKSEYGQYLSTDDGPKKGFVDKNGKKPMQPLARGVPSPAMKPARPERQGTKRRYNDTSFVGYGEGYADDDLAESTGGEDGPRDFNKKKRRKELSAGSPFGFDRPGQQMGMVGVRR